MSRLDELLEVAREATPAEVSERERERMIQRARVVGAARHRASVARRVGLGAALAAAAAAALVTASNLPPPHRAREGASAPEAAASVSPGGLAGASVSRAPTDLELPTGDRALATDGARFTVTEATPARRRIALEGGAMLFDVRELAESRFEVRTHEAEITVLGTVFTVATRRGATTVRVYEGEVLVVAAGRRLVRTAGEHVHLGEGLAAADPLASEAQRAADVRFAAADVQPADARGAAAERGAADAPRTAHAALALRAAVDARDARGAATPMDTATHVAPGASEVASRSPGRGVERAGAAEVRAWLASGEHARALDAARAAIAEGRVDPWRMLEADALRAGGRVVEAADAYARAAAELASPRREQAGYLEARLRQPEAPRDALDALDRAGVTTQGSPLRERGLALRARLLGALSRDDARREVARAYLRDYPEGSQAAAMQALLDPAHIDAAPVDAAPVDPGPLDPAR